MNENGVYPNRIHIYSGGSNPLTGSGELHISGLSLTPTTEEVVHQIDSKFIPPVLTTGYGISKDNQNRLQVNLGEGEGISIGDQAWGSDPYKVFSVRTASEPYNTLSFKQGYLYSSTTPFRVLKATSTSRVSSDNTIREVTITDQEFADALFKALVENYGSVNLPCRSAIGQTSAQAQTRFDSNETADVAGIQIGYSSSDGTYKYYTGYNGNIGIELQTTDSSSEAPTGQIKLSINDKDTLGLIYVIYQLKNIDLYNPISWDSLPSDIVKTTGAQTVAGSKTFSSAIVASNGIRLGSSIKENDTAYGTIILQGIEIQRNSNLDDHIVSLASSSHPVNLGASSRPFTNLYLSGNLSDGTNTATVADIITAANSGGSAPSNMVTLDTAQTISGQKTFGAGFIKVDGGSNGTDGYIQFGRGSGNSSGGARITGHPGNTSDGYLQIDLKNNNTGTTMRTLKFMPDNLSVNSNNAVDLGNSTNKWKDLYLAGNISDGTNSASVANIINAGSALSGVTFNGSIITPNTAVGSQLGGSGAQWNHLYLDGQLHCGTNGADTAYTSDIVEMTNMLKYNVPNTDGTYVLKAVRANGATTYQWVLES